MYDDHFRLSMIGTLPGGEIFSCNLALEVNDGAFPENMVRHDPNRIDGDNWQDIVDDVVAFWSRAATGISEAAVLKRVKLAGIGPDGRYIAAPRESAVNVIGSAAVGSGNTNDPFPNQISRKVTFEANEDLGRIKGGFYLPAPRRHGWNWETQLTDAAVVDDIETSVVTLINNLSNEEGLDTDDLKVVIASQGRFNRPKNGPVTTRVAPGNHEVQRVSVGRRLDVQRRRANKVAEARPTKNVTDQ